LHYQEHVDNQEVIFSLKFVRQKSTIQILGNNKFIYNV
jgi:hypothetical protein